MKLFLIPRYQDVTFRLLLSDFCVDMNQSRDVFVVRAGIICRTGQKSPYALLPITHRNEDT